MSALDTYRDTLRTLDERLTDLEVKAKTWPILPKRKRKNYGPKVQAAHRRYMDALAVHRQSTAQLAPEDFDVLRAEAGL